MSYAGPEPRLASPQSIGLHIDAPGSARHYRNGVAVEHHAGSFAGTEVCVVRYANGATAAVAGTHRVDRIEFRDEPGGVLLGSDDFASLAAWTAGTEPGWSAAGGYAVASGGANVGDLIHRTLPGGTGYIELIGCSIEDDPTSGAESWVGFMGYRPALGAGASVFDAPPAWLLYVRNNGESELLGGTLLAPDAVPGGWTVGFIG